MIALAEQGGSPRIAPLDAVLGGSEPVEVFGAAARLREAGWRVRLSPGAGGVALVREADASGASEALIAEGATIFRVDRAGERASSLGEALPEPPHESWAARGGEPR
jgi:hypothetical protein